MATFSKWFPKATIEDDYVYDEELFYRLPTQEAKDLFLNMKRDKALLLESEVRKRNLEKLDKLSQMCISICTGSNFDLQGYSRLQTQCMDRCVKHYFMFYYMLYRKVGQPLSDHRERNYMMLGLLLEEYQRTIQLPSMFENRMHLRTNLPKRPPKLERIVRKPRTSQMEFFEKVHILRELPDIFMPTLSTLLYDKIVRPFTKTYKEKGYGESRGNPIELIFFNHANQQRLGLTLQARREQKLKEEIELARRDIIEDWFKRVGDEDDYDEYVDYIKNRKDYEEEDEV